MQFDYGSQFASYEPNAIKIWASTATATSGLTINDLKITTPGVTGQTVFPGASIAVSQASGTVFQEIIIAGIDFQSVSGGTVTLQGNVTMQFGTDPALRGSALQFQVIATHIPWVDLDVDSNNDGTIDRTNGRRGTDDRIEQSAPGKIIPVGGDRAEMLITLPAGRSATLEIDPAVADKVRVFDPTGKEVLNAQTHSTTVSGSSPQMLSIQALAPSTTAGDIVFTLTGDSSGPSARDLVRATALVFSIDGPGEIDADTRRGWVSLLVNPDDYGPVDRAADGLPVQFRVFRNGVPAFTSSVDIADGAAVLPVPTSTVPGDTYNVEGWFAGRKIGTAVFPIVAGAPATITPSAPQGSIVTDGQRVITVTADIRDRHGNVVEDGTPVEWLLENLSSSFASLPTRFSSVTSGGRAEVSFRAPDTLSSPVVRIRSGSATRLVELPATFTTATLAGPVSLDIATAESGTVTLATDATDGTPVFWTISNGDIRTYAGVVGGGQAQLAVAATGTWGRVGPCVVTATVGGRLAVHVIDFYSSDPFFLEIDRMYIKLPFFGTRKDRKRFGINRKRAQRLMRLMGLEAVCPRRSTSRPAPGHKVYPYLLRNMAITKPDQVWASDITYIPLQHGFLYLTAVMDLYSRNVLSWRLSNTLTGDFCLEALDAALARARPEIFNTDQGAQFTATAYTSRLEKSGVAISMDGRGRALDNVFVERLWRTVKYEEVYLRDYANGWQAEKSLGKYFDFYRDERPHQALGYRTPSEVYAKG